VDRIAAWLFPSFLADVPEADPLAIGPCDRITEPEPEPEPEAEP
jgi:hypothetical protein